VANCSRGYASVFLRGLALVAAFAVAGLVGGSVNPARSVVAGPPTEFVVELEHAPLAEGRSRADRDAVASEQASLRRQVAAIPSAHVRWSYRYVLNGLSVVAPQGARPQLESLRGVTRVYRSVEYHRLLDQSVPLINAPQLWGSALASAGQGVKIGIIDDGVDQGHPFFSSSGFAMPAGFPKGNTGYTSAKVIAARAFAPPGATWKYASRPFDPRESVHATHVAGIAAGDYAATRRAGRPVSGVAPRAYIGNYKVLTVPTPDVGLDGNSPEIVKGIDAAVADGMDVINLSLGEPQIDTDRDLVVKAIDAAADAGVVPVIAAGNDFDEFGYGSVSSPGNAPKAITAAAVGKDSVIADFSGAGPSGIDLGFKPDVSAPGVSIYSSVPGGWDTFSGTSMAAPHVAGGAALLLQQHPSWTPAQVKSALALTGRTVWTDSRHVKEVLPTREGGGLIDLAAANNPLIFASPTAVSFRFLRRGETGAEPIGLTDAGGGAGAWSASVQTAAAGNGTTVSVPPTVMVPGSISLQYTVATNAAEADTTGFVVLTRGAVTRRIPFWLRVTARALVGEAHRKLTKPGIYHGSTAARPARVSCYRYPTNPSQLGVPPCLPGPELPYRARMFRPVANFGVVILSRGRGVRVQPRVVRANDENRLTGYAGLPLDLNPYRSKLDRFALVAGAERPDPFAYDIVFDTPSRRSAGKFTFRYWINDTTPPRLRLVTRSVPVGKRVRVRATDAGSGVDPGAVHVTLDGRSVPHRLRGGQLTIATAGLGLGRHRLVVRASDYQEAKNMENTGPILPNTRTLSAAFSLR